MLIDKNDVDKIMSLCKKRDCNCKGKYFIDGEIMYSYQNCHFVLREYPKDDRYLKEYYYGKCIQDVAEELKNTLGIELSDKDTIVSLIKSIEDDIKKKKMVWIKGDVEKGKEIVARIMLDVMKDANVEICTGYEFYEKLKKMDDIVYSKTYIVVDAGYEKCDGAYLSALLHLVAKTKKVIIFISDRHVYSEINNKDRVLCIEIS